MGPPTLAVGGKPASGADQRTGRRRASGTSPGPIGPDARKGQGVTRIAVGSGTGGACPGGRECARRPGGGRCPCAGRTGGILEAGRDARGDGPALWRPRWWCRAEARPTLVLTWTAGVAHPMPSARERANLDSKIVTEDIKKRLALRRGLSVLSGDDWVRVLPKDQFGFAVEFRALPDGYVVSYDGWHEHFGEVTEAPNCFAFGLEGPCRVEVVARGGAPMKWTLQTWADGS